MTSEVLDFSDTGQSDEHWTVSKAMLGKPLRELFRAHRYHLELNWSIQQAVEVKQERL